jgi:hypothetical protein
VFLAITGQKATLEDGPAEGTSDASDASVEDKELVA